MTNEAKHATQSTQATREDRERILGAIWHRNAVRRHASLPLLDVRSEFEREVRRMATARYLALLQPYLHQAMLEIGGHPGIAGRLVQRLRGTQIARRRLREETGLDHPDHGLSMATGSAWYLTILEIEKAGERPVFGLYDAPYRSC
ncbi:MAG: hypothetical protein JNK19_03800 [Tabrizicola sp.]|nr:hypothetical protein [Tabrizicola sp.]